MAVTFNQSSGAPISGLNTTPLIDVMLVLIVMLIITLPLQTHAVKVDVPIAAPTGGPAVAFNILAIDEGGQISWNGTPVTIVALRDQLARTRAMSPEPELRFAPAGDARFDTVDRVLATVKRSGVSRFGFVGNDRYAVLLR